MTFEVKTSDGSIINVESKYARALETLKEHLSEQLNISIDQITLETPGLGNLEQLDTETLKNVLAELAYGRITLEMPQARPAQEVAQPELNEFIPSKDTTLIYAVIPDMSIFTDSDDLTQLELGRLHFTESPMRARQAFKHRKAYDIANGVEATKRPCIALFEIPENLYDHLQATADDGEGRNKFGYDRRNNPYVTEYMTPFHLKATNSRSRDQKYYLTQGELFDLYTSNRRILGFHGEPIQDPIPHCNLLAYTNRNNIFVRLPSLDETTNKRVWESADAFILDFDANTVFMQARLLDIANVAQQAAENQEKQLAYARNFGIPHPNPTTRNYDFLDSEGYEKIFKNFIFVENPDNSANWELAFKPSDNFLENLGESNYFPLDRGELIGAFDMEIKYDLADILTNEYNGLDIGSLKIDAPQILNAIFNSDEAFFNGRDDADTGMRLINYYRDTTNRGVNLTNRTPEAIQRLQTGIRVLTQLMLPASAYPELTEFWQEYGVFRFSNDGLDQQEEFNFELYQSYLEQSVREINPEGQLPDEHQAQEEADYDAINQKQAEVSGSNQKWLLFDHGGVLDGIVHMTYGEQGSAWNIVPERDFILSEETYNDPGGDLISRHVLRDGVTFVENLNTLCNVYGYKIGFHSANVIHNQEFGTDLTKVWDKLKTIATEKGLSLPPLSFVPHRNAELYPKITWQEPILDIAGPELDGALTASYGLNPNGSLCYGSQAPEGKIDLRHAFLKATNANPKNVVVYDDDGDGNIRNNHIERTALKEGFQFVKVDQEKSPTLAESTTLLIRREAAKACGEEFLFYIDPYYNNQNHSPENLENDNPLLDERAFLENEFHENNHFEPDALDESLYSSLTPDQQAHFSNLYGGKDFAKSFINQLTPGSYEYEDFINNLPNNRNKFSERVEPFFPPVDNESYFGQVEQKSEQNASPSLYDSLISSKREEVNELYGGVTHARRMLGFTQKDNPGEWKNYQEYVDPNYNNALSVEPFSPPVDNEPYFGQVEQTIFPIKTIVFSNEFINFIKNDENAEIYFNNLRKMLLDGFNIRSHTVDEESSVITRSKDDELCLTELVDSTEQRSEELNTLANIEECNLENILVVTVKDEARSLLYSDVQVNDNLEPEKTKFGSIFNEILRAVENSGKNNNPFESSYIISPRGIPFDRIPHSLKLKVQRSALERSAQGKLITYAQVWAEYSVKEQQDMIGNERFDLPDGVKSSLSQSTKLERRKRSDTMTTSEYLGRLTEEEYLQILTDAEKVNVRSDLLQEIVTSLPSIIYNGELMTLRTEAEQSDENLANFYAALMNQHDNRTSDYLDIRSLIKNHLDCSPRNGGVSKFISNRNCYFHNTLVGVPEGNIRGQNILKIVEEKVCRDLSDRHQNKVEEANNESSALWHPVSGGGVS